MKKTIFWNDCVRTLYAVLGAFVLAVAGMGAVACDGAAVPSASPPGGEDDKKDPVVTKPPKVTAVQAQRSGEGNADIAISWTNPATKNYDYVTIQYTPKHDDVEQPIQLEKGTTSYDIEGADLFVAYSIIIVTWKDEVYSDNATKAVAAMTLDPDEAIALAMNNATGGDGSSAEQAIIVTPVGIDLTDATNVTKVFGALLNANYAKGNKAFYALDLSRNSMINWTNMQNINGIAKVCKLILPNGVVSIPDELRSGDTSVFDGWTSLEEISGSGVGTVGLKAFRIIGKTGSVNKNQLKKASFPNATVIKNQAFDNCFFLEEVDIPKATSIGNNAFYGCYSLQGANFPAVTTIGDDVFRYCSKLNETNVNFDKLETVGKNAFNGGTSTVNNVTNTSGPTFTTTIKPGSAPPTSIFPELKAIGNYTFATNPLLITADFPKAETLGEGAFRYNAAMTTAKFPAATTVGASAFRDNSSLTTLTFSSLVGYAEDGTTIIIGGAAFQDCWALTTIPADAFPLLQVTKDNDVFKNCFALTEVHLPALKVLGQFTFYFDYLLKTVDMPALEEIRSSAFAFCESLDPEANDCVWGTEGSLKTLRATIFNVASNSSPGHTRATDTTTLPAVMPGPTGEHVKEEVGTNAGKVIIKAPQFTSIDGAFDSVTSAEAGAFYYLPNLVDAKLPSLEKIPLNLFTACPELETVELDVADDFTAANVDAVFTSSSKIKEFKAPKLIRIPSNTNFLRGKTTLEVVEIPEATTIPANAFDGCTALATVDISSVVKLNGSTFKGCSSLTTVTATALEETSANEFQNCVGLQTIDLPALKTLGNASFQNTGLLAITLPATATSIGIDAFKQCAALVTVTAPGLTSIGNYAFNQCPLLTTVITPAALTSLGQQAFEKCPAFTSWYVSDTAPTTTGANVFGNISGSSDVTVTLPVDRAPPLTIYTPSADMGSVWGNETGGWVATKVGNGLNSAQKSAIVITQGAPPM